VRWALFSISLVLGGCGYVADPQPPALHIPEAITDLRAVQRGDKVILQFTVPHLTTEGLAVERVTAVDARGGPGGASFNVDAWAESARRISASISQPGPARVEVSAGDWIGNEIVLGVRVAGRKGRLSEWSNRVTLQVVPPLATPSDVRAEAAPTGVRLRWSATNERPEVAWRIYRRMGNQQEMTRADVSDKPEFIDTQIEYGKSYEYAVQATTKAGTQEAESEMSVVASVTPLDTFAPETPTGLTALAGADSVELAWDPRAEPDLHGYRVYRAGDSGEFAPVGDIVETPAYSDRKIESGKRYKYAVSAVDRLGNESMRCEAVEITAP
jgi:hypothetical protein